MCYAEKLLISRQDQLSPMHTHVIKAEDIINRGGATLVVELFGSDDDGNFASDKGGTVWCDGIRREFAPGEKLKFAPGESVTLQPGDWHAFWGEGGDVLIGEVSTVNDDETDNIFRSTKICRYLHMFNGTNGRTIKFCASIRGFFFRFVYLNRHVRYFNCLINDKISNINFAKPGYLSKPFSCPPPRRLHPANLLILALAASSGLIEFIQTGKAKGRGGPSKGTPDYQGCRSSHSQK